VLANGDVVTASASENPDLFKGAAGSVGTLGITTKLELKLIPARRFVKLVYHPYSSVHETIKALRKATEDPQNDYVDGIMYSPSHGVLMTGQLTDDIPATEQPQKFSGSWDPWFYLHAQRKPTGTLSTDYIPTAEYLFRYDRGGFWVGTQAFRYFNFVPFNRYTRWFLNDFMHTRMMYRALHAGDMSFGYMIQDLSLPYDTAEDFIHYTAEKLGIWPLWLCPLRAIESPTFHPCTEKDGLSQPMLNIGLWGTASTDTEAFVRENRDLYSHTYYTEEEFWKLYDQPWYQELRQRYSATTLPTVYDKVKVDIVRQRQKQMGNLVWLRWLGASWPWAGFVGIWYAIKSRDYRIHRRPCWTYWKSAEKMS
jgi:Delta24-sterol reductase